jgi:hypothetical protein
LSHQEATDATKILQKAIIHFYRHLMMLENYVQLNYTGFEKILKKHDKTTGLSSVDFLELVQATLFFSHKDLSRLIKQTENMFQEGFAGGNLLTAKARLLARQHDYFDWHTLGAGLFSGMALVLLALLLLLVCGGGLKEPHTADLVSVLPVYRLFAIPILAIWLWGINVLIWHKSRINHVYIFQFKPGSSLNFINIFKLAAILTVLWSISFVLYVAETRHHFSLGIPRMVYPLTLTVTILTILFCPMKTFHRSSRVFVFKSLCSVIASPFGRLRFFDFYLGDVLTSMVKTIVDLEYTACYYISGDFLEEKVLKCKEVNLIIPPVVSCLPLFWRMMQCLRRYAATKQLEHLANSTKYAVGFSVIVFSSINGDFSSYSTEWSVVRVLWVISFVGSTLYMYTWDFFMDWGLGRIHSKNFPLRDKLFYANRKWFYYYVIGSNFVFRFFWAITLSGTPIYIGVDPMLMAWIAAAIEITRRFTWSLLRVENEYQSHSTETFRETDFIPLPFEVNKIASTKETELKQLDRLLANKEKENGSAEEDYKDDDLAYLTTLNSLN